MGNVIGVRHRTNQSRALLGAMEGQFQKQEIASSICERGRGNRNP
jgi:hypothetical protein